MTADQEYKIPRIVLSSFGHCTYLQGSREKKKEAHIFKPSLKHKRKTGSTYFTARGFKEKTTALALSGEANLSLNMYKIQENPLL